jgi:TetR/AcrR family transcriptional regulator, regulator of cefoperazone and chloramphenicol sensitivity
VSGITGDDTRQRILTAALEVFAEFGFQAGTIREIVLRARVNQAAVNYHFQSKERLYQEVLRSTFTGDESFSSRLQFTSPSASPEEKVTQLIATLLSGIGHQDAYAQRHKLLAWELVYPTGMMERVRQTTVLVHFKAICDVVRVFLPNQSSEFAVSTAALWLIGQCLVFHRGGDLVSSAYLERLGHTTTATTEKTIHLITDLALKGLRGGGGTW